MLQNDLFLKKADALRPALFHDRISVVETVSFQEENGAYLQKVEQPYHNRRLKKGDRLCLDFGNHIVGRVTLKFGYTGSHPDAPAWLRLKFAERPCELFEDAQSYRGWISMGWIQHEQVHLDILPTSLELPRRYAFRYLEIEVLDVSRKYQLVLEDAVCDAFTSADDAKLEPYKGLLELQRLDAVACRTLRSCMQDVFEDGPKRDRRLWLGDLRMQALVNYETFRQNDLVKRCLYLFAGSTLDDGRIGACLFIEPSVEVDDTVMFDYSLFFIATLLDYYKETADMETLTELAPTCWRQLELSQAYFDEHGLVQDQESPGWCFVDWKMGLNKQASAQGIYMFCLKAAIEIAKILQDDRLNKLKADYDLKKTAAEKLWNGEFYVSGEEKQISWASQVWLVLGGAAEDAKARKVLQHLETTEAVNMVTPYMYHNYVDSLMCAGLTDKALEVLKSYWGGMLREGADTFWELYDPENPNESPYGGTIVNSYCHAWSCAPAYFLRKFDFTHTGTEIAD